MSCWSDDPEANDWWIEPDVLAWHKPATLFYPVAGDDWRHFLMGFPLVAKKYLFCDIRYDLNHLTAASAGVEVVSSILDGRPFAPLTRGRPARDYEHGRPDLDYRWLEPGERREHVRFAPSGQTAEVRFRRGFGQYALKRLPRNGLSVFVHRGDSTGEGGSNVFFLENRHARHPPLRNLLAALAHRIMPGGLVISDGSNVGRPELNRFRNRVVGGREAYEVSREGNFEYGGMTWRCVGFGDRGRGCPSLVWQVQQSGPATDAAVMAISEIDTQAGSPEGGDEGSKQ